MTPSVRKFGRYFLLCINDEKEAIGFFAADKSSIPEIKSLSLFLKKISSKYLLLIADKKEYHCDELSLRRLLRIAENNHAGIIYSDFILRRGINLLEHPLIDYQQGSIRDDFNFGHILIFSCAAVKSALQKYGSLPSDPSVALYDLRLKVSIDYPIIHVPEFLYAVADRKEKFVKSVNRIENHFAYAAAGNIAQQKKLEKVATNYLKKTGAYLKARTQKALRTNDVFPAEASIIIPVLNRKKTIKDAIQSALAQKTNFDFNIIVVDNHSTDGTTEILKKYAAKYSYIHHIIPQRRDLGIGGCWNEALYSSYCGRYAIQLDSDDLYSSKHTLQKIVDTLRKGNYALVVGSYTIVNECLKKIPPGLIAHKEWTQANGHNNALRINGLGAPRAFNTAVIRKIGFPNVSYGEDYAVALRISREYKIGRIYENLYWCRRWTQNTDAGLSVENKNRNDFYKDKLRTVEIAARKLANQVKGKPSFSGGKIFAQFSNGKDVSLLSLCRSLYDEQTRTWPILAKACSNLSGIKTRKLPGKKYNVSMQYNPARAVSSGAAVDAESIKNRPCFLCRGNLPSEQQGILYRNHYLILCNPAPIFKNHYTIVALRHKPQEINESIKWFLKLSADVYPDYTVFYNGPACGASAPDHLHFQMIPVNALPFLTELKELPQAKEISSVRFSMGKSIDRSVIVLESKNASELTKQFSRLLKAAQKILLTKGEPLVNIICTYTGERWRLVIFLRRKHRPDAYFAEGENRIFISPGAIDMAGVIITPRLDDYKRLNGDSIRDIYREVSLPEDLMNIIINKL
jgi:glycosyltransferase involved in cell wall biosynthesis